MCGVTTWFMSAPLVSPPICPTCNPSVEVPGPQGIAGPAGADGADGADGAAGADGADGTNGTNGTNGTDGSVWYNGAGAPAAGLGAIGDYYLDTATSDVYSKSLGGWAIVVNIKGTAGSAGTSGVVLQVVTAFRLDPVTCNVDIPWDGTQPQLSTDGVQILTANFTPTATGSLVLIDVCLPFSLAQAAHADVYACTCAVFLDATENALTSAFQAIPDNGITWNGQIVVHFEWTATDTNAHVFTVKAGPGKNGGGGTKTMIATPDTMQGASTIRLWEIAAPPI